MKTTTKFALGGVGLAVCCLLVISKLGILRTPSSRLSFLEPRHNVRQTTKSSKDLVEAEPSEQNHKQHKEKSVTPTKRNRLFNVHDDDTSGLPNDKPKSSQRSEKREKSADPLPDKRDSSTELLQDKAPISKNSNELSSDKQLPPTNPQQAKTELDQSEDGKIKVGALPEWWQKAWARSAVYAYKDQFVGDKPLFPACKVLETKGKFYPFVEPSGKIFPPTVSKNPCWYQSPRSEKGLRCAPFVYLAGVAKCGTSDLYKRLRTHPDFFPGTQKEYHWWERFRFGMYDEDHPEKTVNVNAGQPFNDYLQMITGLELADLQRELRINGFSVRLFGDFSPSYIWDPHNWYVLDGNQGCDEPRMVVGQHIRHLWPPARIIMTFRHPTPRLYSRFISRIHRTPDLKKATSADFHEYVKQSTQLYMTCFQTMSIRQCAYNVTLYRTAKVRMVEGMYPVFMQDWLRVWPSEQLFIMRYEDYQGHERQRIMELFHFLGLRSLDKLEMDRLLGIEIVNSGQDDYQKYGQMLPETKQILDTFYQPFIDQFAQILNDQRFLWKDVYQ